MPPTFKVENPDADIGLPPIDNQHQSEAISSKIRPLNPLLIIIIKMVHRQEIAQVEVTNKSKN